MIEKNTSALSDRIVELENDVKSERITILEKKVDEMEQMYKSHNVIIEGCMKIRTKKYEKNGKKMDELFEELEFTNGLTLRIGWVSGRKTYQSHQGELSFPSLPN